MKPVKVGVIGIGTWAEPRPCAELLRDAELVALLTRCRTRRFSHRTARLPLVC